MFGEEEKRISPNLWAVRPLGGEVARMWQHVASTAIVVPSTEKSGTALTEQCFGRMPRNLSVTERKEFVERQHQLLEHAVNTYKTSEESRKIVNVYAEKQGYMLTPTVKKKKTGMK